MKTKKHILLVSALLLFVAACTNDNALQNDNEKEKEPAVQGTTFVGGLDLKADNGTSTRTSLQMTWPGGTTVDYFWEMGDKIYTADGASGEAQITSRSATALFKLNKMYTAATVDVYYPGQNATAYNQVTIAKEQTQTAPNSTKHLGESGDCGVATAHKQPNGTYKFDLDHKASYLCLLPRTPNGLVSTYITRVKITSDNNIAGTYTLTPTGLTGSGSSDSIVLTTPGTGTALGPYNWFTHALTTVPAPGFPLNNAATSQATNAMYVVIAPGTHALTIEYTLHDTASDVKGTFTKTIASAAYAPNTVYPLTANINPTDYTNTKQYMWDAQDHYWAGYESETPNPVLRMAKGTHYPQSKAADPTRWYNDAISFPAPAIYTAAGCPNINECLWYAEKGEPIFDNQTLFSTTGHLWQYGIWFKKKANIPNYNPAVAPDGTNYITSPVRADYLINTLLPGKPTHPDDYFFLPILGDFTIGLRSGMMNYSDYWTSSSNPAGNNGYYLFIGGSDRNGWVEVKGRVTSDPFTVSGLLWSAQ